MTVYITLNVIIILTGLIFKEILIRIDQNESIIYNKTGIIKKKKKVNKIYFLINFMFLFFIMGFRGDFTTDYNNYINLFDRWNSMSINSLIQSNLDQELGYIILNKLLGMISADGIIIILFTSFFIVYLTLKEIHKDSKGILVSILMFVCVGAYYTSFNITRQIFATTIIFSGSKYIYEKKFLKFLPYIICATLIHKSSIIMIVFYFILNFKFNIKTLFLYLFGGILVFINLDLVMNIIISRWYTFYSKDAYGMSGFNFNNIIFPICIFLFFICHYKLLKKKDVKVNVWCNAITFYMIFSILGLKIEMVQRCSQYFIPYVYLLIPEIIFLLKDKKIRIIYLLIISILLVLYNFIILKGSGYDPYYFSISI